jgi:hypothetical protein
MPGPNSFIQTMTKRPSIFLQELYLWHSFPLQNYLRGSFIPTSKTQRYSRFIISTCSEDDRLSTFLFTEFGQHYQSNVKYRHFVLLTLKYGAERAVNFRRTPLGVVGLT